MKEAKIDERGRVVIPKDIREELRLSARDKVVFVKEVMGYVILPRERYKHPTEALKKIAVKASGHPNPKKEAREWVLSRVEK